MIDWLLVVLQFPLLIDVWSAFRKSGRPPVEADDIEEVRTVLAVDTIGVHGVCYAANSP